MKLGRLIGSAISLVGAAAMTIGVAGWRAPAAAPQAKAKQHFTIGFIPGITTDPFYVSMQLGAEAEAKKLGVTLDWTGNSQWNYSLQDPYINGLIAKHVNFLIVAPDDLHASIPALEKAIAAGIPVGTVDTTVSDQKILKFMITSNNILGGEFAARWVAQKIGYHGQVAVINDEPGISTTDLRNEGFLTQIKKYPHIKVVADEMTNDEPSVAEADVNSIMLAHPDVKAIYAVNTQAGTGAADALLHLHREQNLAHPTKNGVWLIAYDAEPPEVRDLNNGSIQALIVQKPYLEGEMAVQYAYDYLTGHKNLIKHYNYLTNILVTKANEKSESQWFYK
ncbi:MAG: ABC transporter substrate-binding protein [Firmicutes bacterium]|nr:ABC transporter substrate-binding protein [Bacillota bacterium]